MLIFTSINTKMGSLLTFKIKGTQGPLLPAEQIQEIFTHLVSESVLELRESGAVALRLALLILKNCVIHSCLRLKNII